MSPTRNDTILDLILSSDPDLVSDVLVLHNLGNSDHNMVSFTVHSESETFHSVRQVRDYRKGDYDGIREQLRDIDWDSFMSGDMESSWTKFKELLLKLECKFIPIKRIAGNGRIKKPVWMTRKALKYVRKKSQFLENIVTKDNQP